MSNSSKSPIRHPEGISLQSLSEANAIEVVTEALVDQGFLRFNDDINDRRGRELVWQLEKHGFLIGRKL